jgi:glutamate formiminotransferase
VLECVVNVSEGRDASILATLADAAADDLLDLHADPHHHRAVLTLVGEEAVRSVARAAVELIDLRTHDGVHPRLGAVDVVPFVPLAGSTPEDAQRARDEFAAWFADTCAVPCFLYGEERSLPDVRRTAFRSLTPDLGPTEPHATAGACAVGARGVLVAYNVWISGDLAEAKRIAAAVRGPGIRALGLPVGDGVQVSMNLIDPSSIGPAAAYDRVAREAPGAVEGAELVGLVPAAVLEAIPAARWSELDLTSDRTIEARLERRR